MRSSRGVIAAAEAVVAGVADVAVISVCCGHYAAGAAKQEQKARWWCICRCRTRHTKTENT